MLAKDGCGNEPLLSLEAGFPRAVNQTALQTANGLLRTELPQDKEGQVCHRIQDTELGDELH